MQYSSINELWDDHEGGGSSKEEEGNECEPEPVLDVREDLAAYNTNSIPSQWWITHSFFPKQPNTDWVLCQLNTIYLNGIN